MDSVIEQGLKSFGTRKGAIALAGIGAIMAIEVPVEDIKYKIAGVVVIAVFAIASQLVLDWRSPVG